MALAEKIKKTLYDLNQKWYLGKYAIAVSGIVVYAIRLTFVLVVMMMCHEFDWRSLRGPFDGGK